MSDIRSSKYIHIGFQVGLLIKGIDGLLEILGGFLLIYLNPLRIHKLAAILTQHELLEDPKDYVANALLSLAEHFSIDAQSFGIIYLFSHGLIKCLIIFLLWKKYTWAYPLSIIFITLFIIYQIYRYIITPSLFMIILTIFDIFIIVLTYIEYQKLKT